MNKLYVVSVIGIILVYAGFGWLGSLFAIPPGYATAVFPSSGIALAALLLIGRHVWPGIFLGSIVLNTSVFFGIESTFSPVLFLLIILIGAGATFQALLGAYLIQRFVKSPTTIDSSEDIFKFMGLGGPVSCLVGASIAVISLTSGGIVSPTEAGFEWWTRWIGNTIGILVFTPLAFVFFAQPRKVWRNRIVTIALPLFITFLIVAAIFTQTTHWDKKDIEQKFNGRTTHIFSALKISFSNNLSAIQSIERFYNSSSFVSADEFQSFVKDIFLDQPGIDSLLWAPRVTHQDREKFEASIRSTLRSNFKIVERTPENKLIPALKRSDYFPVTYAESLIENKNVMGVDLGANPTHSRALEKARDTGEMMATGQFTFTQDNEAQFGFLIFMPIYKNLGALPTVQDRRNSLLGFTIGVFEIEAMLYNLLEDYDLSDIDISIEDQNASEGNKFIFGPSVTHPPNDTDAIHIDHHLDVANRTWVVHFSPEEGYLASERTWQAWVILAGGLVFVSVFQILLLVLTGRTVQTEKIIAERSQELVLSENLFSKAFHSSPALMSISDPRNGMYLDVNQMWMSTLGYGEDEAINKTPVDLNIWSNVEQKEAFLERVLQDGSAYNYETVFNKKDRTQIDVSISGELVFVSNESRLLSVVYDMTEQKEIDRMKGEFISTVSHELRTPLTSIKGSLALVTQGVLGTLPEEAANFLDIAYRNSERLIALVNDILDMEKIQSGKLEFEFENLNLSQLVKDAVETNAGYASEHGVNLVLGDLPKSTNVKADSGRLIQVIANLLSNAIKFSSKGGDVGVEVTCSNNIACVSVIDHGRGIPKSFRSQIFGRFTQVDSSDSRVKGGTGLGLNISKSIIETHGGELNFDSEEGVGTTFFFRLPVIGMDESIPY